MSNGDWETACNIGNILMRQGALSRWQVNRVAEEQELRRKAGGKIAFGALAVQLGLCTQVDVDTALEEQKRLMAPPSNEAETQAAIAAFGKQVRRATRSSDRLQRAVTRQIAAADVD